MATEQRYRGFTIETYTSDYTGDPAYAIKEHGLYLDRHPRDATHARRMVDYILEARALEQHAIDLEIDTLRGK